MPRLVGSLMRPSSSILPDPVGSIELENEHGKLEVQTGEPSSGNAHCELQTKSHRVAQNRVGYLVSPAECPIQNSAAHLESEFWVIPRLLTRGPGSNRTQHICVAPAPRAMLMRLLPLPSRPYRTGKHPRRTRATVPACTSSPPPWFRTHTSSGPRVSRKQRLSRTARQSR